jgi:hypothetical protein
MNAPVTTLDQRYSGTTATAVTWDDTLHVLETAELFWISTVRADGRPHVTPVVAAWSGLDVVVEGEARWVTDESALERAARAFAAKWQGAWQFTVRDGRFYNHGAGDWPSEVFSVTPAKVFAHAKGEPYGATTHRFR